MTVQANDGPVIVIGIESPLGTANQPVGVAGVAPYISGSGPNPDAGPNVFFAGSLFKDMRYRYRRGGGSLSAGGYPNQAVGISNNRLHTLAIVPSAIATANIAALQSPTLNTPLTLVAASGAGITVETASYTVLSTGNVVPTATLLIDALPSYTSVSFASGAIQAWGNAACGRAVSITSTSNLSGMTFLVSGYDLYGYPQTERITGPNNTTVNGRKGFKWIASVVPSATNGGTVSIGTADIFEFPVRADFFSQTQIWWNETLITANTGFVAADTTSPATATTGSVRGTYAVQSASDGVKRLVFDQRVGVANLISQTGVFGVTPA